MPERGRWDWLCDLVERNLEGSGAPSPALIDAIVRLGMRPDSIADALASLLAIAPARVSDPDPHVVATIDGRRLALVLPALLRHDHPAVRQIGEAWLRMPAAAYAIPIAVLESWLSGDGECAGLLVARLRDEGLALVGPDALRRLAATAARSSVRTIAHTWVDRLSS